MAAFPPKIWMARFFKPYRSKFDPEDLMTYTLVHIPGYMEHALHNTLGQNLLEYAKEKRWGCLMLVTKDVNGLGPVEEMENLKVETVVEAIIQMLINPKFGFGEYNKIIITAYSWGGWQALIMVSQSEQLRRLLGGMLLMAPAIGCFLPVFQEVYQQLESMQDNLQVQGMVDQLVQGHVVRLGPAFGNMANFPMSNKFQMSSWKYDLTKLDFSNLTFPITLIVGTEDPRVKVEDVEAIFDKLPAGNTHIRKIKGLTHDYSSKALFGSTIGPELERLGMASLPNLANVVNQGEENVMEGLDLEAWTLTRKPNKKRVYQHHTSGKTFEARDRALAFQEANKVWLRNQAIAGPTTVPENFWSMGRSETEEINPQDFAFDLTAENEDVQLPAENENVQLPAENEDAIESSD